MSPESQYPGSPLDREISCIRLLTLRQGETSSIECDLVVYPVSSCPPFTALSYALGPPDAEKTIALNSKVFNVRNNLFAALQAILDHKSKAGVSTQTSGCDIDRPETWGYFWIDAICIDQGNILERNHQVGLMKQIYSNATFVLAWLGDASADEESGMREFSSKRNQEWREDELKKMSGLLKRLFDKEYFTRVWIIQEIVLAQNVLLMCGSQTLKWGIAISWFTDPRVTPAGGSHRNEIYSRGYSLLNLIEPLAREDRRTKTFSLRGLLFNTWLQNCSDFRDSIYALLGLMESRDSSALQADYSLTREQLFEQVTEHMAHWDMLEDAKQMKHMKIILKSNLEVTSSFANACFEKYMPNLN